MRVWVGSLFSDNILLLCVCKQHIKPHVNHPLINTFTLSSLGKDMLLFALLAHTKEKHLSQ